MRDDTSRNWYRFQGPVAQLSFETRQLQELISLAQTAISLAQPRSTSLNLAQGALKTRPSLLSLAQPPQSTAQAADSLLTLHPCVTQVQKQKRLLYESRFHIRIMRYMHDPCRRYALFSHGKYNLPHIARLKKVI